MQPNRKEIKSRAREIIKGNIWNMWKPLIAIMLIAVLASTLISTFFYKEISCTVEYGDMIDMFGFDASIFEGLKCTEATAFGNLLNLLMTFAEAVLGVGVIFYVLKLVRGEEFELKDIFKFFKENLWLCVLTAFLVYLFTALWTMLLIIPGIIAMFAYSMWTYIFADKSISKENMQAMDIINLSKKMTKGHKWNMFVFNLSFILWHLLCIITFGLACIYVVPYISAANALYYEEVKKLNE